MCADLLTAEDPDDRWSYRLFAIVILSHQEADQYLSISILLLIRLVHLEKKVKSIGTSRLICHVMVVPHHEA